MEIVQGEELSDPARKRMSHHVFYSSWKVEPSNDRSIRDVPS